MFKMFHILKSEFSKHNNDIIYNLSYNVQHDKLKIYCYMMYNIKMDMHCEIW